MKFLDKVTEFATQRHPYLKTPYFKTFLTFLFVMAVATTVSVGLACDGARIFTRASDFKLLRVFLVIFTTQCIIFIIVSACWHYLLYGLFKKSELQKRSSEEISGAMLHNIASPLSQVRRDLELLQLGKMTPDKICSRDIAALDALISLTQIRTEIQHNRNHVELTEPINLDPADIVMSQKECYEICARPRQISVAYDLPKIRQSVIAHPAKIQSVIDNLVYNAIKYNKDGGKVYIKIRVATKGKETRLNIVVKDTGMGISKEDQERIYEESFRSDNVSGIDGTGMGLALVESIVTFYGGKIFCASKLDNGTTFTVKLPLKRA